MGIFEGLIADYSGLFNQGSLCQNEGTMDFVKTLTEYVRHASVSADGAYVAQMEKTRAFLSELLKKLGFEVRVLGEEKGGHPVVFATRGEQQWPHVVLYGHYDVQPPDPLEKWDTPPFEATVKGDRIYGRGTADNKGPQVALYCALERLLRDYPDLPLRMTFILEGEEETGSNILSALLKEKGKELTDGADFVLLADTGSPSLDQIVVTTSLRGILGMELRMTGPSGDLHSGLHGGCIYNPIQALCELCASLHNPDGSVNVPGFYDGVEQPAQWERDELKKFPLTEKAYQKMVGVSAFHCAPGLSPLESLRFGPTLEFNGIGGGYQGEGSKTVIPSEAFAKITCRLVTRQDPEKVRDAIEQALRERCPRGVRLEIVRGQSSSAYLIQPPGKSNSDPAQNPVLSRAFGAIEKSVQTHFGKPPLCLREGGSVPVIGDIKRYTGLDSLMVGLFMPEDGLHAPNESFHLEMARRGEGMFYDFLHGLAKA